MPPPLRTKDHVQDRDFYCSFTNLVLPNPAELPYTLHNPSHKALRQQQYQDHRHHHHQFHQQQQHHHHQQQRSAMPLSPRHRRVPSAGGPRPDSFDSTKTARTSRSIFSLSSCSSTSRRRLLLAKIKQLFTGREPTTHAQVQMLRASSRKPSTLDFRCVGMESRLDVMAAVFSCGDRDGRLPPRIDVDLPGEADAHGWGRWFEGVF